jgi:peroxiredoxin
MWQAEIGNAKVNAATRLLGRGDRMDDFTLCSTDGAQVSPYDYRGRSSLVVFFAGDASDAGQQALYAGLATDYSAIREHGAEVLLILPHSLAKENAKTQPGPPFPVLLDLDSTVHKAVGAVSVEGAFIPALYVTDRYLEVYAAWRSAEGHTPPTVAEVLSWLAYIESECPECTQIEWPKDE